MPAPTAAATHDANAPGDDLAGHFERIYREAVWTDALPNMPRSGRGALPEFAASVIEFVEAQIDNGTVASIADLGCGDLTYVSTVPAIVESRVSYRGVDVVASLIEEHQRLPWGTFEVADITAPDFRVSSDLILIKDVLFHLTNEQVARVFENLDASTWKLAVITSSETTSNEPRTFDRWHFSPLDPTLPPFSLRPSETLPRPEGGSYRVYQRSSWR